MRHKLFFLLIILPLTGVTCFLPQRKHTFIPPTNVKDRCKESDGYFYSALYNFCLTFPSENWSRSSISLPIDILGTNITTYNVFSIDEKFSIFTLYVAPVTDENREIFERELIPIIYSDPLLVGYTLNPDRRLPPDLTILQADVEDIVKNIVFD